jgi:DNA (cytosine-5)-methyltransferase 1
MVDPAAMCFTAKDHGGDAGEIAPTLRAGTHSGSHANAGVMPAVAFDMRGREGGAQFEGPHGSANLRAASGGSSRSYVAASAVRRLTPRECERLQGFEDDFTLVPHRGGMMKDGPRYKMLGNSMAVPVVRWIGERIAAVEALGAEVLAA